MLRFPVRLTFRQCSLRILRNLLFLPRPHPFFMGRFRVPINITQGSSIQFTVCFFDATNLVTVPPSAILNVVYTSVSGSTASTAISLAASGEFFTGFWDSSVAALGFANYNATAPGEVTSPAVSGQIRVIRP